MLPYMESIHTHPFGNILREYGEYHWTRGFYVGCVYGVFIGTLCCIVAGKMSKR